MRLHFYKNISKHNQVPAHWLSTSIIFFASRRRHQGDQIGRFYIYWAIFVYWMIGQVYENNIQKYVGQILGDFLLWARV
jgi:hypothetical protein